MTPSAALVRNRYTLHAFLLAVLIIAAVFIDNQGYLFHTKLYEAADPGANTLSVIRASQFREIYGAYSRWGFHHPGPAVFYWSAAFEGIFYRWLQVVPSGYNAQVLGTIILTVVFFVAGLALAARWVQSRYFGALALLFAALHFTGADLQLFLISTWPPHVLPFVFFCLLVAAASVAAGRGEDLPWLVTAGCFAMHSHVAQPLFVLPLFALGYAGLTLACYQRRRAASAATVPVRLAPWRTFPRAHVVSGVLAAVFALPLLLDLCAGSQSNFALILEHMHSFHGEHHPWLDSIYYFLRFSSYKTTPPYKIYFGGGTRPGDISHYLADHAKITFVWAAALVSPLLALLLNLARRRPASGQEVPAETALAGTQLRAARWRFFGWLTLVWLISVGLTLVWGHLQDGPLLYYNAWFNYSIYYVLALLAAIALSDALESLASNLARPALAATALTWSFSLAAALICVLHRDQVRCFIYAEPMFVNQARTVLAALQDKPSQARTKLLLFPTPGWGAATGSAVILERMGFTPRVLPDWKIMFGRDLALPTSSSGRTILPVDEPVEVWRIAPAASDPDLARQAPLIDGFFLKAGDRVIDPARGDAITFAKQSPNADNYVIYGWSPPGGSDAPYTWSVGTSGALHFRVVPILAEQTVEMVFDCFPAKFPGKREAQRLRLSWNGVDLGSYTVATDTPLRISIPARVWNARPDVWLVFEFPDAMSPSAAGLSDDARPLALGSRQITFHSVDASAVR